MRFKVVYLIKIIFIALIFTGCNPAKHISSDKYLLNKNRITLTGKKNNIKKSEIKPIIKQKSNKRVLGFRFHLWLYNRAKEKKGDNWLKRIGEAPVVYDQSLTVQSVNQIEQYLNNKGYFNSQVKENVQFKKKKAEVNYIVDIAEPYVIGRINYLFDDPHIAPIVLNDTTNTLLHIGENFDQDILQQERIRIEKLMKNNGYYKFNKEYIFYEADSAFKNKTVSLTLSIKNALEINEKGESRISRHKKYYISQVNIIPNTEKKEFALDSVPTSYYDTILYKNLHFFYKNKITIKPNILSESNYILPFQYYNQNNVDRTYNKLSSLKVFKTTNISFKEENASPNDTISGEPMDCEISMLPYPKQGYAFEIEGTNTGGNFGVGGNLLYKHKNLFRGAEQLDIKLNANIEFLGIDSTSNLDFSRAAELGAEGKITFPTFLFPFATKFTSKNFNPKTILTFSYTYQRLEHLTGSVLNTRLGYNWKSGKYISHYINPFEVNSVAYAKIGGYLKSKMDSDIYLQNKYSSHVVTASNYILELNTQNINKNEFYIFLRYNLEFAGNLLYTLYSKTDIEKDTIESISSFNNIAANEAITAYTLFNVPFSQFVKTDIDLRLSFPVNQTDRIVTRLFGGVVIPYKNSSTVPFERQYFSGGANGIRAWQLWRLGPGDYYDDLGYQTGDIKLEANIEYRFKLFWVLEGAMFVDAGNIWTLREQIVDEKKYRSDKSIDITDIAVGNGFGLRLNFPFFLLRLDAGYKLYDPAQELKRSIKGDDFVKKDKFNLQFGIGYPF